MKVKGYNVFDQLIRSDCLLWVVCSDTGIYGVGGAVRGAFLTVFDLPNDVYIATSGAIAVLIDSSRLVTYLSCGIRLTIILTAGFILFIPASYAGAAAGKIIVISSLKDLTNPS